MGKRRLRNLAAIGGCDVTGYDRRADRIEEVKGLGHKANEVPSDPVTAIAAADAVIISTPPDHHLPYLQAAVAAAKPVFVEASVIIDGLKEVDDLAKQHCTPVCPSCTLTFHPAIREINRLVKSGELGRPANFSYHCGQYLPDWHVYEPITEYYVSNKATGGGREIVPFELTWVTKVFGNSSKEHCVFGKTIDLGVDIDDTYAFSALYGGSTIGNIIVDVVARPGIRHLTVNLTGGQIIWDWEDQFIRVKRVETTDPENIHFEKAAAAAGYNANITESMYIDEMQAFLQAARGEGTFPNTLLEDIEILETLARLEESGRD